MLQSMGSHRVGHNFVAEQKEELSDLIGRESLGELNYFLWELLE